MPLWEADFYPQSYGFRRKRRAHQAIEALRGWAGYFHYRNSTSVMSGMKRYSRNRLRRWIWRKHASTRGLWTARSDERLHTLYGLYALPSTAAWKAAR